MQQVKGEEIREFTYESEEERSSHVSKMKQKGWLVSGQLRVVRDGFDGFIPTEEDYEWFARFYKFTM